MGWAVGYDDNWSRDIGYGVPAWCDYPGCSEKIDRGLGYVCGNGEPYGGERGCGLFFCDKHGGGHLCERCRVWPGAESFPAKPDHPDWIKHKLTDESWQEWRDEHPLEVEAMRRQPQGG